MNIKEIMNSNVETITRTTSLQEAAELMQKENTGFLVIAENDEFIGTITDRDIVVRGIAEKLEIDTTAVQEIMTPNFLSCHEEHTVDEVANHMNEEHVQRMPVVNSDNQITGIVSIGDMAQHLSVEAVGQALKGITEPCV